MFEYVEIPNLTDSPLSAPFSPQTTLTATEKVALSDVMLDVSKKLDSEIADPLDEDPANNKMVAVDFH